MEPPIYSDEHGVKITRSEFIAKKTSYSLDGIVMASINLIRASFTPAIVLILLGIAVMITGLIHLYSHSRIDFLSYGTLIITANRLAIFTGILLLMIGIIWSSRIQDKYAVHIVTHEGDKILVTSKKKDYVRQIVTALQKALKIK